MDYFVYELGEAKQTIPTHQDRLILQNFILELHLNSGPTRFTPTKEDVML
jgi:hypothetical protein